MIEKIQGTQNAKFKLAKSLLLKKNRIKNKMFTVEGKKSVDDAIEALSDIVMIFVSESFFGKEKYSAFDCYLIPDGLFEALCDTKTPQGILAVIRMKEQKPQNLDKKKAYIYCDTVSDPGNLGTIIRTADAAGFGGVLLSEGCADLYSPKTVRSSMGSFFHIPIFEGVSERDIRDFKNQGFGFFCGALMEDAIDYTLTDFTSPTIIAVGNEANGITNEVLALADQCIKIPILGQAESLNVGIAAAILMYEALRQRKLKEQSI